MSFPRRSLALSLAALLATLVIAGAGRAAELVLEEVARDLPLPLGVVSAGDERLFVVTKPGQVLIVDPDGTVRPEPFLDLSSRIHDSAADYRSERGLLGLAFHPDYAENGYLFAFFSARSGESLLARYQASPTTPDRVDPSTEEVLLRIAQPGTQHKGGQLQFGPDGHLYVATGDGHFDPLTPLCTAQERDGLLGKILRLDVDASPHVPPFYRVPADNPFAGQPDAAGEVFLYGLRNPWRFSFDRATGDLYVADVGSRRREEIDFLAAGDPGGGNYGWKRMEGTLCHDDSLGCRDPLPPCGDPRYVPPVMEYEHGDGRCSVIGGYVYRGRALPGLDGSYLFGDLCGDLFVGGRSLGEWGFFEVAPGLRPIVSFGEDRDGELLLIAKDKLYRLVGSDIVDARRGALRFTASTSRGTEGEWLTVEVERQGGRLGATTVAYATLDGEPARGDAVAGEDYQPTAGVLSWGHGEGGVRSFRVRLLADDRVEGTERFTVELSAPGGDAVVGLPGRAVVEIADADLATGPCVADAATLCLAGGRFRLTADWATADALGAAAALPITDDTGGFWFFGPQNVELLVKVLDGCGFEPPHHWVFAAGLTAVAVELRVVDTATGDLRTYHSAAGIPFAPIQDTAAFATCP